MNPNRAMATVRRIDAITPIDGADRIETLHIGGWTVVAGKGDFEPGDLCVYFEVDTFLPSNDSRYAQFAERGEKEMIVNGAAVKGHVLRTVRLRGQYSQGLAMRPQDVLPSDIPEHAYEQMCERRANISGLCGVREYEPIRGVDQGSMGILRRYDPWVAPRTDAERIQNVSEDTFAALKRTRHLVSIKVDGTSITMLNDPRYGKVRAFSHNNEIACDSGFGEQVYKQAVEQGIVGYLDEHPGITLQMEACGPKINGNRLGLKAFRLFVFSAWDTGSCQYLDPYNLYKSVGGKAHYELDPNSMAPRLYMNIGEFETTTDLIDWADGLRGHVTDRLDEGVVIHVLGRGSTTDEEWNRLQHALGAQMQVKCISRRYLLKAKE